MMVVRKNKDYPIEKLTFFLLRRVMTRGKIAVACHLSNLAVNAPKHVSLLHSTICSLAFPNLTLCFFFNPCQMILIIYWHFLTCPSCLIHRCISMPSPHLWGASLDIMQIFVPCAYYAADLWVWDVHFIEKSKMLIKIIQ